MKEDIIDTEISNEELLRLYRETSNRKYLNQLYLQTEKLVYYVYQENAKKLLGYNLSKEEILSSINFGVAKIIKEYSFDRNMKFSTAVYKYATYEIQKTCRWCRRRQKEAFLDSITTNASSRHDEENLVSLTEMYPDESVDIEEQVVHDIDFSQKTSKLYESIEALPEKSRTIIEECYFKNKNNEEIGKVLGAIPNSICRTKTNTLKLLREMLTDPNYLEKQKQKELNRCHGSVRDIPANYKDYSHLLNERENRVLYLRLEEKKLLKEIAEEFGLNECNIGSILQVAAKKIRIASNGTKVKIKPSMLYGKLYDTYKNYVMELKEMDQVILALKYNDHKTYSEISEVIDKPIKSVCSMTRSSENRFKKLLIKHGVYSDDACV